MRELTQTEIKHVEGGNPALVAAAYNAIQIASGATAGSSIGVGVGWINENLSDMSLGEALYRTFN